MNALAYSRLETRDIFDQTSAPWIVPLRNVEFEIDSKHKEIISSRRIDKHRITGIETMGDEILVGYSNCTGKFCQHSEQKCLFSEIVKNYFFIKVVK